MIKKFLGSEALKNHRNLPASVRVWVLKWRFVIKLLRSFLLTQPGCYRGSSFLVAALSHWSDPRTEMEIEQGIELV